MTHKDLAVWKNAMDLAEMTYKLTKSFPKSELFGIVSQMRRSAVSISSNIAEGAGRHTRKEYIHFCYIAQGSLTELETQLLLCKRLEYFTEAQKTFDKLKITAVQLGGLIKALKNK